MGGSTAAGRSCPAVRSSRSAWRPHRRATWCTAWWRAATSGRTTRAAGPSCPAVRSRRSAGHQRRWPDSGVRRGGGRVVVGAEPGEWDGSEHRLDAVVGRSSASGNGTAPASFLSVAPGGADTAFAIASDHTLWQHKNAGWTEISSGSFAQISASETASGADLVFAALSDGEFWDYSGALLPGNPWSQAATGGPQPQRRVEPGAGQPSRPPLGRAPPPWPLSQAVGTAAGPTSVGGRAWAAGTGREESTCGPSRLVNPGRPARCRPRRIRRNRRPGARTLKTCRFLPGEC